MLLSAQINESDTLNLKAKLIFNRVLAGRKYRNLDL
jgi:hypothetical protein